MSLLVHLKILGTLIISVADHHLAQGLLLPQALFRAHLAVIRAALFGCLLLPAVLLA